MSPAPRRDSSWWGWGDPSEGAHLDDEAMGVLREQIGELTPWPRPSSPSEVKLPPAAAWATRTQTLSVLGSSDGSSFPTLKPSAGYTFNPASGNTATVTFPAATARYVRVTVTGNTGWPAGQLSEFEVHPS